MSYYYLKPTIGIKLEPYYRFYLNGQPPKGMYIEPRIAGGSFNTWEIFHTIKYTYDTENNLIKEECLDASIRKELFFYSYGGSLRFGYQNQFGTFDRVMVDISLGFQYFLYNIDTRDKTESFYDIVGNQHIFVTSYGSAGEYFPENNLFWYIFGPGSVFNPTVKLGYTF